MQKAELKELFIEEFKEIIAHLETDIVKLEEDFNPELVNDIFRYVHTVKGSSGMVEYTALSTFSHELENLLDMLRAGRFSPDGELVELLLQSIDWMKLSVFDDDDSEESNRMRERLISRISQYREMKERGVAPHFYFNVRVAFNEEIFGSGIDPLRIMEDLLSRGEVMRLRVNRERLPAFGALDPEKCYLGWEVVLKTKQSAEAVADVFLFVKDDNMVDIEDITAQYAEDEAGYHEEKRLGEILVNRGILTEDELTEILSTQENKNRKLGELVVEKGYATEGEVRRALHTQEDIRRKVETSTVRVDTGKLDNLMNLLGEIVIGQSSIARIADELADEVGFRLKNALYGVDRTTREFQEQLMAIRMIPIGPTFEQFRRFVRDTAQGFGKEIGLEITGRETELDKTVIERISDPLKHLIRNAIDHGIEPPDEREEAGKKRSGSIRLSAYHQEGSVYVEVADDGRGINREKIRTKALRLGLLGAEEEADDATLFSFLFVPGFSTAESVGDLSGRGVGMDVVRTNIESLRGSVGVESSPGKGTTVRIKLPLTLAIIEGMLVRVGEQRYIVPLLSIVESLQPAEDEVKTIEGRGEVVLVRGEYVPLLRLYELFGVAGETAHPWEALVVIVESSGRWVGLMVDELLGQQQIVIKNVGTEITRSRALSGAAILGDGRIALIIDVHGLLGEVTKERR